MKNILVTTKHRGVFVGTVDDDNDLTREHLTDLQRCKMVVRWRNSNGLPYFAKHGPTENCQVSKATDALVIRDVTAVFAVTDEAAAKIWADEQA